MRMRGVRVIWIRRSLSYCLPSRYVHFILEILGECVDESWCFDRELSALVRGGCKSQSCFPSNKSTVNTDRYSNIWAPEEQKDTIKVWDLISMTEHIKLIYPGYYYTLRSIRTTTGNDVHRTSAAYTTKGNASIKEKILTVARICIVNPWDGWPRECTQECLRPWPDAWVCIIQKLNFRTSHRPDLAFFICGSWPSMWVSSLMGRVSY
jgi:hypothetical protein